MIVEGLYHSNLITSKRVEVVFLESGELHVSAEDLSLHVRIDTLHISSRVANIPRVLEKEGFFTLEIADNDAIDAYLKRYGNKKNIIHMLEKKMRYSLLFLLMIFVLVYGYFMYGTALIASLLAPIIPDKYVEYLGQESFEYIDKNFLFQSRLSEKEKKLVQNSFARVEKNGKYKLFIRSSSSWIGANALALPNGYIIITDEMAELTAFNKDALSGIFAHEMAHVDKKHSLKNIAQTSLSSLAIFLFSGDISSGLATLSSTLLYSKYSREFEEEADNEAIKRLNSLHISTVPLARVLHKIAKESKLEEDENYHYFSSHPDMYQRIEKFKANSL